MTCTYTSRSFIYIKTHLFSMPPFPGEGPKPRVAQKLDFEDDRPADLLNLITETEYR